MEIHNDIRFPEENHRDQPDKKPEYLAIKLLSHFNAGRYGSMNLEYATNTASNNAIDGCPPEDLGGDFNSL
jgi:hypothetical protein